MEPLLHLWSLAIEEQFYIVWPLILFTGWKKKSSLFYILLVIAAASFACNLYWIRVNPIYAFYLPITRAWELAAGGLLAILVQFHGDRLNRASLTLRSLAASPGLACVVASFVLLRQGRSFPQFHALAPVLGTLLIIGSGAEAWVNRKVLALQLLVACGLVSFPLYLWHWPLLVFARVYTQDQISTRILTE